MSNFKFTPKKGVIANVTAFVRASTATAAITAANGLETARFVNKSISDGLKALDVAEEMAMVNAAQFFTKQLGKKVSIQDIRDGNVTDLVAEASEKILSYAEKKGQHKRAKEEAKLNRKIAKLNRKIAALKGEEQ